MHPSIPPPGQRPAFRLILAALLLAACAKEQPDKPAGAAPTPAPTPFAVSQNLLSSARGAVVTERTGEMALSSSPVYAIDPLDRTAWITPTYDPDHSVTIALPARSRVERVGVSTGQIPGGSRPPKQVIFEGSADGATFTKLATVGTAERKDDQLTPIAPAELTHLRATIADGTEEVVAIGSLLAGGSEIAAYRRPAIAGTWELNGLTARFGENGARVWGEIGTSPPTLIEGGWSGRVIRYVSLRGREFGYGIISVSPDGRSLNVRWWYEEVIPLFEAVPYYGRRTSDAAVPSRFRITEGWLSRFKRVPLYGIEFDEAGNIDAAASAETLAWIASRRDITTLLKREYSQKTPEENLALSQKQIESLKSALTARGVEVSRIIFEAAGSTGHKETPATLAEGPMFSRVEAVVGSP